MAKNPSEFVAKVTVIAYCTDKESMDSIAKMATYYPGLKILVGCSPGTGESKNPAIPSITEYKTKADALNAMSKQVHMIFLRFLK